MRQCYVESKNRVEIVLQTAMALMLFYIPSLRHSYLFKRKVNRFKRAGYSLDIMRQTACLVFNPIMVEGFAALLSCTAVVQASDSMTASM